MKNNFYSNNFTYFNNILIFINKKKYFILIYLKLNKIFNKFKPIKKKKNLWILLKMTQTI